MLNIIRTIKTNSPQGLFEGDFKICCVKFKLISEFLWLPFNNWKHSWSRQKSTVIIQLSQICDKQETRFELFHWATNYQM